MGRHGEEILFDGLYLKYSVSFGGSLGGLSSKELKSGKINKQQVVLLFASVCGLKFQFPETFVIVLVSTSRFLVHIPCSALVHEQAVCTEDYKQGQTSNKQGFMKSEFSLFT